MSGVLLILFVLVVNILVAFISVSAQLTTGSFDSDEAPGCSSSGNQTVCGDVGRGSFFSYLLSASFEPFTGAPPIVNIVWVAIMSVLLTTGALLIVLAFIPITSA